MPRTCKDVFQIQKRAIHWPFQRVPLGDKEQPWFSYKQCSRTSLALSPYSLMALWEVKTFLLKTGSCIFLFTFGEERYALGAEYKAEEGMGARPSPVGLAGGHITVVAHLQGTCSSPRLAASAEGKAMSRHSFCLFFAPTVRAVRRNTVVRVTSFGPSHFNIWKATRNSSLTK